MSRANKKIKSMDKTEESSPFKKSKLVKLNEKPFDYYGENMTPLKQGDLKPNFPEVYNSDDEFNGKLPTITQADDLPSKVNHSHDKCTTHTPDNDKPDVLTEMDNSNNEFNEKLTNLTQADDLPSKVNHSHDKFTIHTPDNDKPDVLTEVDNSNNEFNEKLTNLTSNDEKLDIPSQVNNSNLERSGLNMKLQESLCLFLTQKFFKRGRNLALELESTQWKDFPDMENVKEIISFIEGRDEDERDRLRDVSITIPYIENSEEYDMIKFRKMLRGCAYLPWPFDCDFDDRKQEIVSLLRGTELQLQLACASFYDNPTANQLLRLMVATTFDDITEDHFLANVDHSQPDGRICYFPVVKIMKENNFSHNIPLDPQKSPYEYDLENRGGLGVLNLLAKLAEHGPSLFFK